MKGKSFLNLGVPISVYLLVLSFMIIGCKSISSSASSTDTSFPTWVVFDSTEFQQAQARGKYPDPIAIYREEGQGSYFYAMAFNPAGKTLNQAKAYCNSLANKGWGHSIRLPNEDDINSYNRGMWIYYELDLGGMIFHDDSECMHDQDITAEGLSKSVVEGDARWLPSTNLDPGARSFWINKQKEDKDHYDAYVYKDIQNGVIFNLASNNRCPFVVCVSSDHLENITKISESEWNSYLDRIEQQNDGKKLQNAKKYCIEHPKESCCLAKTNDTESNSLVSGAVVVPRDSSLWIGAFLFDENNEVIGCVPAI